MTNQNESFAEYKKNLFQVENVTKAFGMHGCIEQDDETNKMSIIVISPAPDNQHYTFSNMVQFHAFFMGYALMGRLIKEGHEITTIPKDV